MDLAGPCAACFSVCMGRAGSGHKIATWGWLDTALIIIFFVGINSLSCHFSLNNDSVTFITVEIVKHVKLMRTWAATRLPFMTHALKIQTAKEYAMVC